MPLTFWIAQALSIVATIIIVISFQIKNKNILLALNAAANVFICVSLFLLDAHLGASTTIVAIGRGFLFFKMEKRPKWYSWFALALVCAANIVCVIFTYKDYFSIIMLAAIMLLTYGLWQKNAVFIRFASICASIVFTIYNILIQAYAIIALESLVIASCIVFLVRAAITRKRLRAAEPPPQAAEASAQATETLPQAESGGPGDPAA